MLQPVAGVVGEVPVGRVLAEEVRLEALEEAQAREHVPVADGHGVAGRQDEHEARVLVVGQRRQARLEVVVQVDGAVAIVAGHGARPAAEVVPAAADGLAARRHALVLDALGARVPQQHALGAQQEVLALIVVQIQPGGGGAAVAGGTGRQRVEGGAVGRRGRRLAAAAGRRLVVRNVVEVELEEVEHGLHRAARTHAAHLHARTRTTPATPVAIYTSLFA